MDFSGTVIIGSSNYNFSGSLTWDPAAIPTDPPVNSQFNADGMTFIFDSTDLTADIGSPTIQLAAPADFLFHFDLGAPNGIFLPGIALPVTGFAGDVACSSDCTSLPADLTPLICWPATGCDHVIGSFGVALGVGEFATFADGNLTLTAGHSGTSVPEPATRGLLGVGLAGIGFARRCNSNLAHTASSGAASGLPARRAAA
jgi:hypothetical protein